MASSAERSAEVSTRGSHISGYGSDLAALFGSGSGSNSVITWPRLLKNVRLDKDLKI